ncbi:MAG: hypothetical protein WA174_12810, partial [Rhodoferax sp.]
MSKKMGLAFAVLAVVAGCATAQESVVPLPGGKYEVTSPGETKNEALKASLAAAESTCKARQMRHVVLAQSDSYKGMVSEGANKKIDAAAQVLAVVSNSWIPTLSGDDD